MRVSVERLGEGTLYPCQVLRTDCLDHPHVREFIQVFESLALFEEWLERKEDGVDVE